MEKPGVLHVDESTDKVDHVKGEKRIQGSEALAFAVLKENPKPFSRRHVQLYCFCVLAFLCSTMNGFDGSLFTSLQAMTQFQSHFGVGIVGARIGIITGMYTIGGVVALLFVGPACDTWGRRAGMFIGCFFVVVGTVISATSVTVGNTTCSLVFSTWVFARLYIHFSYSSRDAS
ncbi:hypothetical protein V1525DRAFT_392170, partial [Lipomyces kononenkoae]